VSFRGIIYTYYLLFLSRSKDKIELENNRPASNENDEKTYPEYDTELETLCEELQATLDGLVRPRDADYLWSLSLNLVGLFGVCLTI
jgi:predicted transposase YdaD